MEGGAVRKDRMRCADGVEREWQVVNARGIVLRYCPDLGHLLIRLSVPRLDYPAGSPWAYNFPLARTLPDLGAIAAICCRACQSPTVIAGWTRQLPLLGVSRIGYAVDVQVDDVSGSIQALSGMRRKGNAVQTWGSPPHACQWRSDSSSTIAYSKEAEIRARRGAKIPALARSQADYRDQGRAFRSRLAEEARGVIRFEMNLKPRAIREGLNLRGGYLPTYEFMTKPEIAGGFLRQEMRRIGLAPVVETATDGANDRDVVMLARTFQRAIEQFEAGGHRLSGSGGSVLSCNRIATLMKIHELTGKVDDDTLMNLLRLAPATLRARRLNLRELGLPCVGGSGAHGLECLRELVDALDRQVPLEARLPELQDADVAEAPWLSMLPEVVDEEDDAHAEPPSLTDDTFADVLAEV